VYLVPSSLVCGSTLVGCWLLVVDARMVHVHDVTTCSVVYHAPTALFLFSCILGHSEVGKDLTVLCPHSCCASLSQLSPLVRSTQPFSDDLTFGTLSFLTSTSFLSIPATYWDIRVNIYSKRRPTFSTSGSARFQDYTSTHSCSCLSHPHLLHLASVTLSVNSSVGRRTPVYLR
jgi:hypothetical protein